MDQGTTSTQRVGLRATIKRHIMNIAVRNVSVLNEALFRIVIFLWNDESVPQNAGAGNNPDAIFTEDSALSLLNPRAQAGKFRILYDSQAMSIPQTDTAAGYANKAFRYISWNKAMNVNTQYGTGSGTDLLKGALYIGYIQNTGSTNYNLFYASRVRYTDD
jgi:hypothetical protein